jgi:hypothetical protein
MQTTPSQAGASSPSSPLPTRRLAPGEEGAPIRMNHGLSVPAFRATIGGDRITVYPSLDRAHVFVQLHNDLESCLVAVPFAAVPWLIEALEAV